MGMLADSLKPPSAYSVKRDQPGLWEELVDRVNGALLPSQLDELAVWLDLRPFDLPGAWGEQLLGLIDKRRDELAEEDIASILRDRYDFS